MLFVASTHAITFVLIYLFSGSSTKSHSHKITINIVRYIKSDYIQAHEDIQGTRILLLFLLLLWYYKLTIPDKNHR